MSAARSASFARRAYASLLRLHPASREGYGPQMASTFDAVIDRAVTRGHLAVLTTLVTECAGLLASRGASSTRLTPPSPGTPLMRNFTQDIRFALRTFKRRPGFTAAVIATLALGIGANAAIFSVANAVLLQRLPFKDPSRLVMVWEDASSLGFPRNDSSPAGYFDLAPGVPALESTGAVSYVSYSLVGGGDPELVNGAQVTSSLFDTFGTPPMLGRVWRPDEDVPGARIAVITHALWTRRFNSDPGIVERTVSLSGTPYVVVGVMPERFEVFDPDVQILTPLGFSADRRQDRGSHFLDVVARLRPEATLALANSQLRALAERLKVEHPQTNRSVGLYAVPLLDDYVGDTRTALVALVVAVGCVLLIACVNVANLMLTHAAGRTREMAVRTALGADRRRLVRQLLTESLLLAFAGGALGIAVATQTFTVLSVLIPKALSGLSHVTLDVRVLAVTTGLAVLTGLLFGIAPAWRASRVETAMSVTRSSRGVLGSGTRVRSALVVTEIALATAVLIAAGLLVQSLRAVHAVPLGFEPAHVLTIGASLPRRAYSDPVRRTQFVDSVLDRVRQLPGVTSAGVTSAVPLVWKGGTSGFIPEGVAIDRSLHYDANNRTVTPGYMETLGFTLRSGRFFDSRDSATGAPVGIINETMARQYWPNLDPLGRRFKFDGPDSPWRTIVGIVADTRVMGIERPTRAEMYFPVAQSAENWMWPRDIAVKTTGDPRGLVRSVSQAVWAVDRDQPISNILTMDEIVGRELQERQLQTTLMTTFAGLALFLAAVGIYGVLSFMVTERTSEIGIRLALGGHPSGIRARFVRRGLGLAALGLAIGMIAAFWGTALIDRLLFNVRAHDWRTFAVQAGVIVVVSLAAAYLPARRASQVDPITALRNE
ncbi:MAG TPA: ABC transporter permease [Vicinamibacterales bacterium]|nr:ABC transporter permease [Vicinamibacterales bacterium]